MHTTDATKRGDRKRLEHRAPREVLLSFNSKEGDETRDAESSLSPEALLDPAGGRDCL